MEWFCLGLFIMGIINLQNSCHEKELERLKRQSELEDDKRNDLFN